jgi:radical SAM family protein
MDGIDSVTRTGALATFFHLAGIQSSAGPAITAHLAGSLVEPDRMASGLADLTGQPPVDVIVSGPASHRVVLLRTEADEWAALSLAGIPLDGISWPSPIRDGCRFETPRSDVSRVSLSETAEYRLRRPVVRFVSLYHEENFPLPRFALGISDLARAVRSTMSGQVELCDMQLGTSLDEIVTGIQEHEPDILGVSATFGQYDLLSDLLERITGPLAGNMLLVLGGSLSALNAEVLLRRYPKAIVARGAGEPTMIDMVEYWYGDRDISQIRNVRYAGSETIVITKKVTNREYDEIVPELDLLEPTLARQGVLQLEASRGCTHACSFCPREHKGIWAGYSADSIRALLGRVSPIYDRYPELAKKVFLVDEEFIGRDRRGQSLQRAIDVAQTLQQAGFRWETSSRVDQVYRPTEDAAWHHERITGWRKLRANGLDRCLFGVESGVESVLKRFNKHSTPDQNAKAIRILTAIGLPIRCTYITFDQLMTMKELVESYRFQGRCDMTLRPLPDASPQEILEVILGEDNLTDYLTGRPFYEHISYMLVSMECLLRSPYLREVEKAGLAREILPSMGRRNAVFRDSRVGSLSDWSQRWVDHNFAFDYTLKSFEKVTQGEEHASVRRVRQVLKASAYSLLGRMLWLCLGDDSLLSPNDPSRGEFVAEFFGESVSGSDLTANSDLLARLADYHLSTLRNELATEMECIMGPLSVTRARILTRAWDQWHRKTDWSLINSPEMCIAE